MTTMAGNDVSKWQGQIDWSEAAQQTGFEMVKATQGIKEIDPDYARNIAALRAAGEHRGSYHYPDAGDPVAEADFYILHAGRQNGEMQALDFEGAVLTHADPVGWAVRFLTRVIERTNNVPLIYMSGSTEAKFDWARVVALNVGLWLASWQATKPNPGGPWPFVIMWQRSDDGKLAGVDGNVDQDVFYGDTATWAKYANNRTAPAAPKPGPAPKPLPKPAPAPKPAPPKPAATPGVHVVVQGDNLTRIAQTAGVSVAELVEWNKARYPSLGWNKNMIHPGWELVTHATAAAHGSYTVRSGDNLSTIAAEHHTTVAALVNANKHNHPSLASNPDHIEAGWTLTLP